MIILETSCRSGLHLYDLPTLFIGALSQSASNPDAEYAHDKHQRRRCTARPLQANAVLQHSLRATFLTSMSAWRRTKYLP